MEYTRPALSKAREYLTYAKAILRKTGCDKGIQAVKKVLEKGIDKGFELEKGAKIILDGRRVSKPQGGEKGQYLAATIVDGADVKNPAYTEELFGPVLTVLRAATLDDALAIVNANPYGNGTAIFTRSGAAARKYAMEVEAGQIGVNLPIPVPPYFLSFTGNKASFLGAGNFYGKAGFRFYTQTKTVMQNWWADDISTGVRTAMPVLGREGEVQQMMGEDKKKK